jgi:transcriptional regulator with GAF, ATPase, and Fis domain
MKGALQLLNDVMPAMFMSLVTYEEHESAIREVARATWMDAATFSDDDDEHLYHLPEAARRFIDETELKPVTIVSHEDPDPVSLVMSENMGAPPGWCTIVLQLTLQNARVGQLVVGAGPGMRFTQEHARLLEPLHEPFALAMLNAMRFRELEGLREKTGSPNHHALQVPQPEENGRIVGADSGLADVMRMVDKVAPLEGPALLLGETGAGKEVVAQQIHLRSPRAKGPMLSVNCGAISEHLIGSELFGHEKGAFTGALALRRGAIERADRGTLFLDEIGELSARAQSKLLRVLETMTFERVGGQRPLSVDVRVIAATHRDMGEMIGSGAFREDLWFRLNVFPIRIPPLRERPGDIPEMARYFLMSAVRRMKISNPPAIADDTMEQLVGYDWPGNVRELRNIVERGLLLSEPGQSWVLPPFEESYPRNGSPSAQADDGVLLSMDEAIAHHIRRALESSGGKVEGKAGAAERLGINPSTLRSRMKKLGL